MYKCSSKLFTTLEAFLSQVSLGIKAKNYPTYHPCCKVWTSRKQTALRLSHGSSTSWGQVLKEAGCSETKPEKLLQAHMIEYGWGLPIQMNVKCKLLKTLSSKPQPQGAFTLYQRLPTQNETPQELSAGCSPCLNKASIRSDPLPIVDPQASQRWPSHAFPVCQLEQLRPIQIEIDPVKAASSRLLADSMKAINQRTYRHIDEVRGFTEQAKKVSHEIMTNFGDSERAIKELIEEQKATKQEIAQTKEQLGATMRASANQTAMLEQKLDRMHTILAKLVKQFIPESNHSTAATAIRTEMKALQPPIFEHPRPKADRKYTKNTSSHISKLPPRN